MFNNLENLGRHKIFDLCGDRSNNPRRHAITKLVNGDSHYAMRRTKNWPSGYFRCFAIACQRRLFMSICFKLFSLSVCVCLKPILLIRQSSTLSKNLNITILMLVKRHEASQEQKGCQVQNTQWNWHTGYNHGYSHKGASSFHWIRGHPFPKPFRRHRITATILEEFDYLLFLDADTKVVNSYRLSLLDL